MSDESLAIKVDSRSQETKSYSEKEEYIVEEEEEEEDPNYENYDPFLVKYAKQINGEEEEDISEDSWKGLSAEQKKAKYAIDHDFYRRRDTFMVYFNRFDKLVSELAHWEQEKGNFHNLEIQAMETFEKLMNTQYYKDMFNCKVKTDMWDIYTLEETVHMLKPRQHTKKLYDFFSARTSTGYQYYLKCLQEL